MKCEVCGNEVGGYGKCWICNNIFKNGKKVRETEEKEDVIEEVEKPKRKVSRVKKNKPKEKVIKPKKKVGRPKKVKNVRKNKK